MGKKIRQAFRELRWTVSTIQVFNSFLDTLIVFAVVLLVIAGIGNLSWQYALYAALPFFFVRTRNNLRKVSMRAVEEKVPELREALRTSEDYLDRENEVVEQLHTDVLRKMRKIKASYFLGIGKSFRRLVFLTVVCWAVILVAVFNVHLVDLKDTTDRLIRFEPVKDFADDVFSLFEPDEGIYAEPTPIRLGMEDLELHVTPLLSEIDVSELKPLEEREFHEEYPARVGGTAQQSFQEDIAREHKEIVNSYFSTLAQE